MEKLNIRRISQLTGKSREKVLTKLLGVPFEPGPSGSKLYPSNVALERVYLGDGSDVTDQPLTESESRRLLNIKRMGEIDVNVECKRKERIPLEDIEEVNDRVFSNVAGIIKANEGKVLSAEAISDMLSELRTVGAAMRDA